MALIVAGDRSGVGKTTVTLAILTCLSAQGKQVQSFKIGPDYIDPMFHQAATGLPCRNLDPVLTSADYVQQCFNCHAKNADWVVIEGVMGLFDGIYHPNKSEPVGDYGSTADIARILDLPVLLVLDCSRLSTSIAAIAYGYANFDCRVKIAGVILNRVASDRHLELLKTALDGINLPILGVIRRNQAVTIPDRHLGLVPLNELSNINSVFAQLAELAKNFDWQKLYPLIAQQPAIDNCLPATNLGEKKVRIAIAKDRAFNFYYQDNLDLLQDMGAELIFWSPLKERNLPQNIQGLYFGGGFPEIFAPQLAENNHLLQQLKHLIQSGIPTYAECGGLMYLCEQLVDLQQQTWSMVGIIPSTVTMGAKLTLGYRKAIALQDSSLVAAKQTTIGHEFHHSKLIFEAPYPQWELQGFHQSSFKLTEGWNIKHLHASYLHLHWGVTKSLPQRFINYCRNYKTPLY